MRETAEIKKQRLQRLKIMWIAADERQERQKQVQLLQENPADRDELIDFILVYRLLFGD